MADIFDELNDDYRAERARAAMKRYGVLIGAVAVLVLAGVGGWQGWEYYQARRAAAAAGPFLQAMQQADALPQAADPARAGVADAFARIAATAPPGYRTLARLREAALRWDAGNQQAAFALWDQVNADSEADPLLRDLASLLWAQHAVDKGDPASLTAHTARIEAAGNPWRPLALEADAGLALRMDDKDKATRLLRSLIADPASPDGLRQRAAALLSALGASPAANG